MARIAIDAACWANRRGYGRYARELMNAVWRIDSTNDYVMIADDHTATSEYFPRSVETRIVPLSERPTDAAGAGSSRRISDMLKLGNLARREPVDIVFFPSVYSYFPYFGGKKVALVIHDAIPERHPADVFPDAKSHMFWKAKMAMALRDASMLITVSEHARAELAEVFALKRDDIRVVSEAPGEEFVNAFGAKLSAEVMQRADLKPGERYFLYVGGFGPHKNLAQILSVYSELRSVHGAAMPKLVMVGDFETDSFFSNHGTLVDWVTKNDLTGSIAFPGFVPDAELAMLYANTLALIIPSKREGFGLPAVEAAAAGAPVIATIHSPLPQVLSGGGIFVDPGQGRELYHAMNLMINDEERRLVFASAARARSVALLWENSARDLMSCFSDLAPGA